MKSFEKIIGYESVKNELYQIIDMFKNKEMYVNMGARTLNGVLIYGRPGLGKTMLAEALIAECGIKAYTIRNNKNERELIREINMVFTEALNKEKCIIFFDDLDKFSESSDNDVDDRIFVTVQANIDSAKDKDVLIIATVNNYRKLPDSLKRSGRFDRKIGLDRPTNEEASKIIEYYLKKKKVDANLNYEDVGKMINYTSCADLETILNESAILSAYARKEFIDINDIAKAYLKYHYEILDESCECSEEVIASTSVHEAGHAVIAEALKYGCVGFLSVQQTGRNNMSGFTHLCEVINEAPENILIALGGKVAVELFYNGRCAMGCSSDLKKALDLIQREITVSGTNGVGMLYFDIPYKVSDSMMARVEIAIQSEMERYLYIAKEILLKNKEFVLNLAEELKKKNTLLYSDIQRVRSSVQVIDLNI